MGWTFLMSLGFPSIKMYTRMRWSFCLIIKFNSNREGFARLECLFIWNLYSNILTVFSDAEPPEMVGDEYRELGGRRHLDIFTPVLPAIHFKSTLYTETST